MTLLLASLGEEHPSGENLEYEKVFTDMMLAAQPGEESQFDDSDAAGHEPDPKAVLAAAEAVLAESHDLRAAVLAAYAKVRLEGYPGLAEVTAYVRGCLENYWDTCHPQLDADDDNDPTMRVNAIFGLSASEREQSIFLRALRRAPLAESKGFGTISLRDVMISAGELDLPEGEDPPPVEPQIAAAFREMPSDRLDAVLAAARAVQEDFLAINGVFDEKLPGQGPDLGPPLAILKRAVARLADAVGEDDAAEAPAPADASGDAPAPARAASGAPGEIASQRDVERALEQIIRYYQKTEPSSPVPIILARARRLIGADFLTIVNDIAPGGADNVRLVGGITSSESGGEWMK